MSTELKDTLLKIALTAFGVVFVLIYPLGMVWPSGWVWHGGQGQYYLQMICGVYAVLGVFLIAAARNPSAHRSLIAFTAWSSFAHASVMAVQAYLGFIARHELLGVATFVVIGVALIALAPTKQSTERTMAVGA